MLAQHLSVSRDYEGPEHQCQVIRLTIETSDVMAASKFPLPDCEDQQIQRLGSCGTAVSEMV
jgi:predicted RNA-binding Zn-ribbon protein involved in translation (DUF1610 family)